MISQELISSLTFSQRNCRISQKCVNWCKLGYQAWRKSVNWCELGISRRNIGLRGIAGCINVRNREKPEKSQKVP